MFLSLWALRCCKRHITFPRQSGKENFFKKDFSFLCPLAKWGSLSYAAIYESVLCAYSSTTVHLKSANAEVLGLSQGAQALQYMSSPLQFSWQLLYLNIMRCVLLMLRHLLRQQRCANDMNNMLFSIFISSVFDTYVISAEFLNTAEYRDDLASWPPTGDLHHWILLRTSPIIGNAIWSYIVRP